MNWEAGSNRTNLLATNAAVLTTPANTVSAWKGYSYRWYRVGGLGYLLERAEADA